MAAIVTNNPIWMHGTARGRFCDSLYYLRQVPDDPLQAGTLRSGRKAHML